MPALPALLAAQAALSTEAAELSGAESDSWVVVWTADCGAGGGGTRRRDEIVVVLCPLS